MFILFGWGHQTTKEEGPTLPATCPNCRRETWLHLLSYKTWLTLFFIPVIPYMSEVWLSCPVCSRGRSLQGNEVPKARRLNQAAAHYLGDRMGEDEFLHAMDQSGLMK